MTALIGRREFLTLLGGAAAAWPLTGLAHDSGKVRRIGFLRVGEPPAAFIDGFRQGLRELGLSRAVTSSSNSPCLRTRRRCPAFEQR
jgi:hypothetical protein